MSNLYELNKAIADFDLEIDEETGEILNMDGLDALQLERDTKIENIALWIKNLTADAKAYKEEKAVFAEKERRAKNKIESLKRYLQDNLDGQKFNTSKVSISYRKSQSVEITDLSILPRMALKEQDPVPDKVVLKDLLKAGTLVAGARLVDKQNMIIK